MGFPGSASHAGTKVAADTIMQAPATGPHCSRIDAINPGMVESEGIGQPDDIGKVAVFPAGDDAGLSPANGSAFRAAIAGTSD